MKHISYARKLAKLDFYYLQIPVSEAGVVPPPQAHPEDATPAAEDDAEDGATPGPSGIQPGPSGLQPGPSGNRKRNPFDSSSDDEMPVVKTAKAAFKGNGQGKSSTNVKRELNMTAATLAAPPPPVRLDTTILLSNTQNTTRGPNLSQVQDVSVPPAMEEQNGFLDQEANRQMKRQLKIQHLQEKIKAVKEITATQKQACMWLKSTLLKVQIFLKFGKSSFF